MRRHSLPSEPAMWGVSTTKGSVHRRRTPAGENHLDPREYVRVLRYGIRRLQRGKYVGEPRLRDLIPPQPDKPDAGAGTALRCLPHAPVVGRLLV
jgi:hypothetical protein